MTYWVLRKNGNYIYDLDDIGRPIYTKDREKALKFYDFTLVMEYVSMGHCAIKE